MIICTPTKCSRWHLLPLDLERITMTDLMTFISNTAITNRKSGRNRVVALLTLLATALEGTIMVGSLDRFIVSAEDNKGSLLLTIMPNCPSIVWAEAEAIWEAAFNECHVQITVQRN